MINTSELLRSGCNENNKEKICRSRGGESCAFDGAMIVLQPISDVLHIVHGPIGCLSNSYEGRGSVTNYLNSVNNIGIGTDMDEFDIVYGSEEKLFRLICKSYSSYKPKAIFVYTTCVSGLIGEDLQSVCERARKRLNIPVIPVDSAGFVGPKNLGNRLAGKVLLDYVIGTKEPPVTTKWDINIIGEYNIAGDLFFVEPILKEAGIRVLSRITGNSTFEEICWAHRAKLNVMICSRALINVAKEMERKYGIPYIEVSFFGKTEFSKALRLIAYHLENSMGTELQKRVNNLIKANEDLLDRRLKRFSELKGKKAFLYTGGVKSWSFLSALKDLNIEVVGVGVKKSSFEDEEKIKELSGNNILITENVSPKNILKIIRENKADFLVAGGRNQYLAIKENIPFVDVNQERHRPYAGYEGLYNLAEDLYNSFIFYEHLKGKKRELNNKPAIKIKNKAGQINPLKQPPIIGSIIALQGFKDLVPLIHGTQGCSFLSKVLLTKHFREPISLFNSGLFTESVVMGSEDILINKIKEIVEKQNPKAITIINSALSDVKGDDLELVKKTLFQEGIKTKLFTITLPDYQGGMEEGFVKTISSIIQSSAKEFPKKIGGDEKKLNVVCAPFLRPADYFELHRIAKSFELSLRVVPDLTNLNGSYSHYSSLTYGNLDIEELENLEDALANLIIGPSCFSLVETLEEKTGVKTYLFNSLSNHKEFGEFLNLLSQISGKPIPFEFEHEGESLIDIIKDAYTIIGGVKISTALQVGETIQISEILKGLGMSLSTAVIPEETKYLEKINAKKVILGDLTEIDKGCNLLISNAHAKSLTKKLGIPLYQFGFPFLKSFGLTSEPTIGYRGCRKIITDITNIILEEKL